MSGLDLDGLRAAAERATPGPWTVSSQYGRVDVFRHPYNPGDEMVAERVDAYDAAFIAAANPDVVLALVERVERAEAAVAEVRAVFDLQCPPMPAENYVDRGAWMAHDWWNICLGAVLRRHDNRQNRPETARTAPVGDDGADGGRGMSETSCDDHLGTCPTPRQLRQADMANSDAHDPEDDNPYRQGAKR